MRDEESRPICECVSLTCLAPGQRKKIKLYLTGCVIQSQQVLLSTDVYTHCKKMTKEQLRGRRREGKGGEGEQRGKGGGAQGTQRHSAMRKANKWF